MKLSAIMTSNPVAIPADAPPEDALELFDEHDFRHLPVLEHGRVVGILTDRDAKLAAGWLTLQHTPPRTDRDDLHKPKTVRELMTSPVLTGGEDDEITDAIAALCERRIGALPVLDAMGNLTGIVTETNMLSAYRDLCDWKGVSPDPNVETCMSSKVESLGPDALVSEAVELCIRAGIRHVPVVDGGSLMGIVSDRDIRLAMGRELAAELLAETEGRLEIPETPLSEIMTRRVFTIGPKQTLSEAAHVMVTKRISALPVEEDARLIGILTQTDLLMNFFDSLG
jgi:CBS domain-containing protein